MYGFIHTVLFIEWEYIWFYENICLQQWAYNQCTEEKPTHGSNCVVFHSIDVNCCQIKAFVSSSYVFVSSSHVFQKRPEKPQSFWLGQMFFGSKWYASLINSFNTFSIVLIWLIFFALEWLSSFLFCLLKWEKVKIARTLQVVITIWFEISLSFFLLYSQTSFKLLAKLCLNLQKLFTSL